MMMIVAAVVLVIGVLVFTLSVRAQDLPEPETVSPVKHLEERRATIYENLRDLQFEYRVGKLSDQDYNQTKQDLQRELAAVLAGIDKILGTPVGQAVPPAEAPVTRKVPVAPVKQAVPPAEGQAKRPVPHAAVRQAVPPAAAPAAVTVYSALAPAAPLPGRHAEAAVTCPHCNARFSTPMKFCGECGKPIPVEASK